MNQMNNNIKHVIIAIISNSIFIIAGLIFYILYKYNPSNDYLFLTIICFILGLITIIGNIYNYLKKQNKPAKIKKMKEFSSPVKAKIIKEKFDPSHGNVIVCTALIDGQDYEFISEPVNKNFIFATKIFNINELTVYVDTNNRKKYYVDTTEVEDRIVDLT